MITCPSCGGGNPAGKNFCSDCGAALSRRVLEQRGRLAAALADAPEALRQALDLYRAIGATGHAQRLARELGT